MAPPTRDEFPEKVKRVLAERASYICSNPNCRNLTIGPHSDPNKSLKSGEACHIGAAASGGPRFIASQSKTDRSNITNGIWLCVLCSTRIDKDPDSFPIEDLKDWKQKHEEWLRTGGIVPALPEVMLTTSPGLSLAEFPTKVTGADCRNYREHSLVIRNHSQTELLMIDARVQLPDSIIKSTGRDKPVGTHVEWVPIRMPMSVYVKGGGGVVRNQPPSPTGIYRLRIDRLPSLQLVEIAFFTSATDEDLREVLLEPTFANDKGFVRDFIDGTFQFEYQNAMVTKRFFAPIQVDEASRCLSMGTVCEDSGELQVLCVDVFS